MTEIHGSYSNIVGTGYDEFWNDKHFWRVVKGSRGSKKSKTTALNLIYRLVQPENEYANILCIRKNSNSLRQSVYTDLRWAINKFKLTPYFHFNNVLPEITFKPTGQKILFRGLNNPLSLTSITVESGALSWVWIEEAYEIANRDDVQTLAESIRGRIDGYDNAFKQITVTFNPWSKDHWLRTAFFDKTDDGEDKRYPDVFADTTTYKVNEWLDEADVKRLEHLSVTDPKRARVALYGEWGILDGQVFSNYTEGKRDIDEMLNNGGVEIYGIDFGYSHDPTAFIAGVVDKRNKEIYLYDEFYKHGLKTQDIADEIKAHGYERKLIYADYGGSADRLIDELRDEGIINIKRAGKRAGSILAGIQLLSDYSIIINPELKSTIFEFNNYIWDKNRQTGQQIDKPVDLNNHIIDALRYAYQAVDAPKFTVIDKLF